ncbi:MAG TPA: hypothetical protein PLS84_05640, partial [Salinivirgaceae bacterium]|nr:hypothetical protein [Salinivirgaceae bacterium]
MESKFTVSQAFVESIKLGLKNFLSLLGAMILWSLTIWIPYLNVGTTIAMVTLPAKMSRGAVISPLEIFNGKYRKFMGEFFLVIGLRSIAIFPAYLFMFFPGMVLSFAYSFAALFVVDKGITPGDALSVSNRCTHGYKWKMFFTYLLLYIALGVVGAILALISPFLTIIVILVFMPIVLGAQAFFYGKLTEDIPSLE